MSNPYAAFFMIIIFCFSLSAVIFAPSILTMIIFVICLILLITI
ncbi:hypothetical protein PXD04_07945 [Methanosphaera sp. ISO3-F5]|nr:hypothetical protein [Methanosphaera sp. ISO3-F5]WQH63626.1 hypothetical protein PXD04_07945 [Methanosphaera sp. ISO3-F5]